MNTPERFPVLPSLTGRARRLAPEDVQQELGADRADQVGLERVEFASRNASFSAP